MDLSKLVRTVLGTGLCRGITAAGTFALNLCLAWQLSLDDCGRIMFCITAMIALAIFARFGFDASLLKFGGAAWHTKDIASFTRTSQNAFLIVAGISTTVTLLGQLLLGMVASDQWHGTPIMQTLLWALPFLSMCYIVSSTFKAAHRPEAGALFEVGGASVVTTLVLAAYAALGYKITPQTAATVFAIMAMLFCVTGILLVRQRLWSHEQKQEPTQNHPQPLGLKEHFRTSADFAIIAYGNVFGQWGSLLFLEYWCQDKDVALFSAAMRIVLIPNLILHCIVSVCSPRISGLHHSQDLGAMRSLVKRSALLLFLVNFPILLTMALGATWLMACFGSDYQPYGYLLSILACGQLLSILTGMGAATLGMAGYHRVAKWIGLLVALGGFALSAILVSQLGLLGAAIGSAVYATTLALAVAVAVKIHLGFFPTPTISGLFGRTETAVGTPIKLGK